MFKSFDWTIGKHGFILDFYEEWSQFFQSRNWYTFRFILLEFENDELMGGVEIVCIVMGLGFRLHWAHTMTEAKADLIETVKELGGGDKL